ncbi:unnamed protein product [Prorocentrum cordatum]|uniref:Uncharacterized protein n=1 Tax=Prorocentrum cordatum TaxID=2364126 RepID=A0ABN9U9I3_9DINO|nr:unnamed protein product [Polarella glacialis]
MEEFFFIISVQHRKSLACNASGHVYVVCAETHQGSWETWHMQDCTPTVFISSACHDKRLSSKPFGGGIFTSRNRFGWEKWVLEESDHGGFFFRSPAHNTRLALDANSHLYTISCGDDGLDHRGAWETWRLSESPHSSNSYFIDSIGHEGKRLACNNNGHVYVIDANTHAGSWESWILERSQHGDIIESTKFWTKVVGACAVGAAAAPVVAAGVVASMGFGAAGIAAGSAGAAMMSAEASVAGGGIAAGGVVATLQSIGASGLGVAGTTALALSGAATGSGVGAALAVALP